MKEPDVLELKSLLQWAYNKVPSNRKGITKLVDYDPAGSTYNFVESEESKRIREIFGYLVEPSGI